MGNSEERYSHVKTPLCAVTIMAPSRKRKRKPLPKRPCPCCGSILSEKTIEHHATGSHVPTRIFVTLTAASQKQADVELSSDIVGDLLSRDSSEVEYSLQENDPENSSERSFDRNLVINEDPLPPEEGAHGFYNPKLDLNLEEIVQNTWSGRRATVEDYESDDEEEEFDGNDNASEPDSDLESERMGFCDGLGMDDLVDEDFQRIIAEFGVFFFFDSSFHH